MKTKLLFLVIFLFSLTAYSQTTVLFHPNGPTLTTIAERFAQAESRIDIAMYNMDVGNASPIMQWLGSPETQAKIKSGTLAVRVILNGAPKDTKRAGKMTSFETLGADVRWLSSAREVHHKFAVIDSGLSHPQVISGSANWSESSRTSYTENIFLIENEASLALQFQNQFNFLWSIAEEFGNVGNRQDVEQVSAHPESSAQAFFNVVDKNGLKSDSKKNLTAEDYVLSEKFVTAIDGAKSEVQIATTRFRLRSIYDAVVRAAQRGVKIQIFLTQAEYWPAHRRAKVQVPDCESIYAKSCSLNMNYAVPLVLVPGVEVRVKDFSLRPGDAIQKQMHSKYLIADHDVVLSGSFNFSISSEFANFENVVRFQAPEQASAIETYRKNFAELWEQNRGEYPAFLQTLEEELKTNQELACQFPPMALSFPEMDAILTIGETYKVRLDKACK